MMSKDPAKRPQSGRDVLRELNQPAGGGDSDNPFAGLATPSDRRDDGCSRLRLNRGAGGGRVLIGILGVVLAGAAGAV